MVPMRSTAAAQALHRVDGDHPLLAALARAPIGEPFTPEQRAMLDEQMTAIREGRTTLVRHEDRRAWLESNARDLDDPNE